MRSRESPLCRSGEFVFGVEVQEVRRVVSRFAYSKALKTWNKFSCILSHYTKYTYITNSIKLVIPLHFISWKKTPNDAMTPQRQSQFTPKMKANAVPRLLSSLVWIDQYYECNRMTSFMEFVVMEMSNTQRYHAMFWLGHHFVLSYIFIHCCVRVMISWNMCINCGLLRQH